ncbi:MAG: hypothetical protein K6B65_01150 [Bacilli bacterium]|nr:hypothetical protein [Bacilli bacterium]
MKNKYIALGLLALAGTLGLGACGGASSSEASVTSSAEPTSSSETTTSEEVVTSTETEVAPTRVKITQPDIVLVGSTIKIADVCAFTPENATLYNLETSDEKVATIGDGVINIVGPGKASVKVTVPNGDKTKTIGTINITAMSKEGKALQDFADSVTDNYFIDATWSYYENNSWDKVTENDKFSETDVMGLVCNPNYVLDWIYHDWDEVTGEYEPGYNAIKIAADGNTYGFTFADSEGNAVPSENMTSVAAELAKISSVTLTERVDPAYINLYFVISDLLDVTNWTEAANDDGSVYFYTENAELVVSTLGTLLGMDVSGYTGVYGEVSLSKSGTLDGTLKFNDSRDANQCTFSIAVGDGAKVAALEEAVKSATPPETTDVTPIVSALNAFATNNFIVDWQIGVFSKTLEPIEDYYSLNNIGETLVDGDTMAYASFGLTDEGALDRESLAFGGLYTDTTNGGVYTLSANEEHLLTKGDAPVSGTESFTNPAQTQVAINQCPIAALTETVLDAASLTLAMEGIYLYTASFDDLALGDILSGFCPFAYTGLFDDPENAPYCEGYIGLREGVISLYIVERVRLSETTSCYQGVIATISSAGEAKIDIGDNLLDAFGLNAEEEEESSDSSSAS